jgi:hypothetical protein
MGTELERSRSASPAKKRKRKKERSDVARRRVYSPDRSLVRARRKLRMFSVSIASRLRQPAWKVWALRKSRMNGR